jgi:hypothetical protein
VEQIFGTAFELTKFVEFDQDIGSAVELISDVDSSSLSIRGREERFEISFDGFESDVIASRVALRAWGMLLCSEKLEHGLGSFFTDESGGCDLFGMELVQILPEIVLEFSVGGSAFVIFELLDVHGL